MSTTTNPVYPASCPTCHANAGWPYAAGTCDRPGVIVVKLRCAECRAEWAEDAPAPVMATAGFWPSRPKALADCRAWLGRSA